MGYLEFCTFKLYETRMNRIKVRIEVVTGPDISYPFEITENIRPWECPYVCVQLRETFNLYSLITGIIHCVS